MAKALPRARSRRGEGAASVTRTPRFAREGYNMKHRAKHSCKLHCQGDVGVWCAEVGRTQGRSRCLLRFVKVNLRCLLRFVKVFLRP